MLARGIYATNFGKLLNLCRINNQIMFFLKNQVQLAVIKNFDSGTGVLNCSCYKN